MKLGLCKTITRLKNNIFWGWQLSKGWLPVIILKELWRIIFYHTGCNMQRCNRMFSSKESSIFSSLDLNVARWCKVGERQSADGVSFPEESTLWPPNRSSPSDQSGAADPRWVHWAPSRSSIWSSIWNNEGNNNELKSPPVGKARGQITYGELTLNTFHKQLEDPSSSERLHSFHFSLLLTWFSSWS